jgi:hypothetical protein
MDPLTTAVLAVLRIIGSEAVKSGVKDAYEGLKAVIRRKWGDTAPISKAISAIEEDPTSKAQAAVLKEKVSAVKATEDAEVAQALHKLVEQMKTHGIGGEAVARIQFNMSAATLSDSSGLVVAQTLLVAIMRYRAVVLRLR